MKQPTIYDFKRDALNACSNIAEDREFCRDGRVAFLEDIKSEIDVLLDAIEEEEADGE